MLTTVTETQAFERAYNFYIPLFGLSVTLALRLILFILMGVVLRLDRLGKAYFHN